MKIQRLFFIMVALSMLGACTHRSARYVNSGNSTSFTIEQNDSVDFILWEVGRDSQGRQLPREVQQADEVFNSGNYEEALRLYQIALMSAREREVQEMIVLRQAAALAVADDYSLALSTISNFFREQGISSGSVQGVSAVMLGLLYYHQSDTSQAVAWLLRGLGTRGLPFRSQEAAKRGLAKVVATSTEAELGLLRKQWPGEPLLTALIEAELKNRSISSSTSLVKEPYTLAENGVGRNYKIALMVPLSGRYRLLGESTRKGVELAVRQISSDSQPIDVVVVDTAGSVETALEKFGSAVRQHNLSAILGPILPEPATAVADLARQLGIPILHFSKREQVDLGRGVFRLGITPSSQVAALMDLVISRGFTSVAVVYPDSPAAYQLAEEFKDQATAAGITVAVGEVLATEPEQLTTLASKIEQANVDAIFFSGNLEDSASLLAGLSEQFRNKVVPLGTVLWYDPGALRRRSQMVNGAMFVVPFFAGSTRSAIKQFSQDFVAQFGSQPNFLAAQGYDAATLLLKAVLQSSGYGQSIDEVLLSLPTDLGLTGTLKPAVSGDILRNFVVVEYKDGEFLELN